LGGNPGRSAHKLAIEAAKAVYDARVQAAKLFNAKPENVVFTYNTTYAINIALKSSYIYGTNVLISDIEHNSVLRPVASVTGNTFASYSTFDSFPDIAEKERPHAIISSIRSHMRPLTGTLICTARSNITGLQMPIGDIGRYCRENGLFFIVDAAQAAGYDDIDIERDYIDALCVPGHKGLYGPQGTAMVIYSQNAIDSARVGSFIEGGNGVQSLDISMPGYMPEMLEGGTLGVPGIHALTTAIKELNGYGITNIKNHDSSLVKKAYMQLCFNDKITIYGYTHDSPMLLFNLKDKDCEAVADLLDKHGICVRAGYHCSPLAHKRYGTPPGGAVRMSVGIYNTEDEIDMFVHAIKVISNS
jgi:selenocysteine lyase/cysteine desulfurase